MADVFVNIPKFEVQRVETAPTFEIKDSGSKLGELTPSSGGVYWLKSGQQGKPHFVSWAKFAEIMEAQPRRD